MATLERPLNELRWADMREIGWAQLVELGLSREVADLAADLGSYRARPIRAYIMPMIDSGVVGLAIPFIDDDGILVDPGLLAEPAWLRETIAHELAHLFYPSWQDPALAEYEEMERFAARLGHMLLRELPDEVDKAEALVDLALGDVLAG